METDALVREWIAEVIKNHSALMGIAIRQRAKFEGWLKFELAAHAEAQGMQDVRVEAATGGLTCTRGDLTFTNKGERCDIELKTCNTNWGMEGVLDRHRPITKNVNGIIGDAIKLRACAGQGIVAFCMFPVPSGDRRWVQYLSRISVGIGNPLSVEQNATRVPVSLRGKCQADVVVVSFKVAAFD